MTETTTKRTSLLKRVESMHDLIPAALIVLLALGQPMLTLPVRAGTPSGTSPTPGSLHAFGWNRYGQLGTGDNWNQATPTPVVNLPCGRRVIAVAGGEHHSIAQADDGSLWAWGSGEHGALGNGSLLTNFAPVPVNFLPPNPAAPITPRTAVVLAAGAFHNLVLADDGTMWAWGYGLEGQLGSGGMGDSSVPIPVDPLPGGRSPVQIAAGAYHNLALASDGTLWAWGRGDRGQLGNGANSHVLSPEAVLAIPGGRNIASIAAGDVHSMVLATDGTMWTWGGNSDGQLGNGGTTDSWSPQPVNALPGGRVPIQIAAGALHNLALANDGSVWAWGRGTAGQLGYGSTVSKYSPFPVNALPGGRVVRAIAAGGFTSYALANDGSLWSWGYGFLGTLGNGVFVNSSLVPVPVDPLPPGRSILAFAGSTFEHAFILGSVDYPENNHAPVAADDDYVVLVNTILTVPAAGVVANEADTDGQALAACLALPPAHAAAFVLNCDGSFTYKPNPDFLGTDRFLYRAFDGTDYSPLAMVTITVVPPNDPPMLTEVAVSAAALVENSSVILSGTFSDADPGDVHTVVIDWGDASASTTLNLSAGELTFAATHTYLDDAPSGTAADVQVIGLTVRDALASDNASTSVTVQNAAPTISSVSGPANPIELGHTATVTVEFADLGTLDSHTVSITWDDARPDTVLTSGGFSRTAGHTYAAAGVYRVGVTVTDDDTGAAMTSVEYIVIYDPNGGFVTGGGWILSPEAAYAADPTLTGKASFGFNSKYQPGANTPTGNTEFQFRAGDLNFKSTTYQWLIVSGAKAQFKGSGQINGAGDFGFLLTATDGQINGGNGEDKFRIKIRNKATGAVVYDNVPDALDDLDAANPQALGGGRIVIHKEQ